MNNYDSSGATGTREITVEGLIPHSPEALWKTLTVPELIAQWLMPNDFKALTGKRFTFKTRPMQGWDGVVQCEVLELIPREKLVYSWRGGPAEAVLDSIVAWTLTPAAGGTHLKMVHAGFRSPQNDFAYNTMSPGWSRIMDRIGTITAGRAWLRNSQFRRRRGGGACS